MKNKLMRLKEEILAKLQSIESTDNLKDFENKYLSRKSEFNSLLKSIKDLDLDLRKEAGILANSIKQEIDRKKSEIRYKLEKNNPSEDKIDPTLPGETFKRGHLHPVTLTLTKIEKLFSSMGFMILDGPFLESDYYNFTALNFPKYHPARDIQDTFFIDAKNQTGEYDTVMRTHTSPMQVRALEKYGAPLKAIIPGKCFRTEATDARHEHTFYQLEGLMVGENINFANLKGFLEIVGQKLYGPETKLRMRPKYYPFVEPGSNGEYTCFLCQGQGCRVCKHSGWLEIVGCGLIHPEVLKKAGLDPKKYSGFAFGFGLDRLVMLEHKIDDVRLFNSGDLRFLEQF